MKNFEISIFDEKKLAREYKEKYGVKEIKEIKYYNYNSIENLILKLDRSNEKEIKIIQSFTYSDIIIESSFIDEENNESLFIIWENGEIYNERDAMHFINLPTTEKSDYKSFNFDIYINSLSEELYRKLENIGVKIVAFSGIYEEPGDYSNPEDTTNFNFVINIDDRKKFILACKRVIENEYDKIHDKSIIEELKSEKIEEIKQLNKKLDRKGKLIELKNKNNSKEFGLILFLLHLEGKIYIRPGIVLNGIWKIDLLISEKIKGNKVLFLDNIEYNIFSGAFINTKNQATYHTVELHRLFLAILIEKEEIVSYDRIYEYFKSNIDKEDLPISHMNTIKGNLLRLLKDNNILKKGGNFIKGKNRGYMIDFSYI